MQSLKAVKKVQSGGFHRRKFAWNIERAGHTSGSFFAAKDRLVDAIDRMSGL